MITPDDLRNPALKSGYDRVNYDRTKTPSGAPRSKPYRAQITRRDGRPGMEPVGRWRATAREAAQDFCDWYNGGGKRLVKLGKVLKSAGHKARRDPIKDDPEVQAALGVLRDARGQQEGRQGYVYLIGEEEYGPPGLNGGNIAKIGYSTNPEARVAELQTGNGRRLKLLGKIKGTPADEAALHAKYADQNVLQEWFRLTTNLLLEFKIAPVERTPT